MIRRKFVLTTIGLIVGINVWNYSKPLWVGQTSQPVPVAKVDMPVTDPASAAVKTPAAVPGNQAGLQDTFNQDGLNGSRTVSITTHIDISDMLKEGEARPEDVYLPLYAEARAPQYMNRFCPEVLATVGTKCIVATTRSSVAKDGSLRISGELNYVPRYDLGKMAEQNGAKLMQAQVGIPLQNSGISPANNALSRAFYLKQAIMMCENLKAQYGNCVITNISLEISMLTVSEINIMPEGTNPERLEAQIQFSVFAPQTKDSYAAFQNRIQELVPVL